MEQIPHTFWIGVLIAGVVSLIGAVLVIWRGVAGGGAAITSLGAISAAWAVEFGYHKLPLADVNYWIPLLALASAVIFSFIAAVPGPRVQLRIAISAGLSSALGIFLILHQLSWSYAIVVALAVGLVIAGVSWCWERANLALSPLNARAVMLASLVGLFGTLAGGGSLRYGFSAALICVTVGAPMVLAFWKLPNLGVAAAGTCAGSWLVVLAYALIDYPVSAAYALMPSSVLIAAAGMAGWIVLLPPLAKRPRLGAFIAVSVACLLAIAAIAWMGLRGQPHTKLDPSLD